MSIAKRVNYLKGLAEGLGLGRNTKEEKVIHMLIEILDDFAAELEEVHEDIDKLDEDMGELVAAVEDLEEAVEDLEDAVEEIEETVASDDDAPSYANKPTLYSVKCPGCTNEITIDDDILNLGKIDCPSCGEALELDLDE